MFASHRICATCNIPQQNKSSPGCGRQDNLTSRNDRSRDLSMSTTNIALLLQAAEYVERKDRGMQPILVEIFSCFDLSDATLECVRNINGRPSE